MFTLLRKIIVILVVFIVGIFLGGYFFSDTQPRKFITLNSCSTKCFSTKELAGLLTSAGLLKAPSLVPRPIFESDKIVVVHYPAPNTSFHEVVFPKKDIRDVSQISDGDQEYIWEAMTYISETVRKNGLTKYKIVSNGPDYQQTTYLHFHIIGELNNKTIIKAK